MTKEKTVLDVMGDLRANRYEKLAAILAEIDPYVRTLTVTAYDNKEVVVLLNDSVYTPGDGVIEVPDSAAAVYSRYRYALPVDYAVSLIENGIRNIVVTVVQIPNVGIVEAGGCPHIAVVDRESVICRFSTRL